MHQHLETLLEIQDLKSQKTELQDTETERQVQEEVFNISIDDALDALDRKVVEMEESLPAPIRSRYNRLAKRYPRVVAPVIRGTCYGCFVSVATAVSSDAGRNEEIEYCESCGRFLYLVD